MLICLLLIYTNAFSMCLDILDLDGFGWICYVFMSVYLSPSYYLFRNLYAIYEM